MPTTTTTTTTSSISTTDFAAALKSQGFDICHAFDTRWYNDNYACEQSSSSQSALRKRRLLLPSGNAFLIGNTKHVWKFFLSWLLCQQTQQKQHVAVTPTPPTLPEDPFDAFVTETITATVAAGQFFGGGMSKTQLFWAHDTNPDHSLISFTHMAAVSGLAHLHPTAGLVLHPKYGPWFSLRAVVVVDDEEEIHDHDMIPSQKQPLPLTLPPPPPPPKALDNPLPSAQDALVCQMAQKAFAQSTTVWSLSSSSSTTGTGATGTGTGDDDDNDEEHSNNMNDVVSLAAVQPWIDLRMAMTLIAPLGKNGSGSSSNSRQSTIAQAKEEDDDDDHVFSDEQLRYHYTKDPNILIQALHRLSTHEEKKGRA